MKRFFDSSALIPVFYADHPHHASLTGLPLRPRITGRTEAQYFSALESVAATILGGAAYGALIAHCAVKAGAEILVTWNLRDFTRFGPEIAQLVKTPLDF